MPTSIDYRNIDYRGFIFAVHEQHGLMLLHCTRKPKKGPHFQLPGGHIDDFEFEAAGEFSDSVSEFCCACFILRLIFESLLAPMHLLFFRILITYIYLLVSNLNTMH